MFEEDHFEADFEDQGWLDPSFDLPRRPERHLQRRPVAPPPLRRPVTLGELIEQLESIAEQLESDELLQCVADNVRSATPIVKRLPRWQAWPIARSCRRPPLHSAWP